MPNNILSSVRNPAWKSFILDTQTQAQKHNVNLILSDSRFVKMGGAEKVNGYFADKPTTILAVACGQPQSRWLSILLHESCHMDQWIKNSPAWENVKITETVETIDLLDLWINRKIELTKDQLNFIITASRNVELDCEKRAVKKIKKYNLPVDVQEYIQRANAYVCFYTLIKQTRKWYTIGKEPYNVKDVWKYMPSTFLRNYDKLAPQIVQALEKTL